MDPQQTNWQSILYNGLIQETGKPAKVATGNITKPNVDKQLAEHVIPSLEVIANNDRNRGLQKKSKQRFSVHRSVSFLPQE